MRIFHLEKTVAKRVRVCESFHNLMKLCCGANKNMEPLCGSVINSYIIPGFDKPLRGINNIYTMGKLLLQPLYTGGVPQIINEGMRLYVVCQRRSTNKRGCRKPAASVILTKTLS
jgi:hypothetical protein